MAGKFQGYKVYNPPYGQANLQWGKNQMPNGKNLPLWGKNPYQQGWVLQSGPAHRPQMTFNTQLSFLATLKLLDVSRLTNDPILHSPYSPSVPSKIPSDCPKFEGKVKEDPQAHMMTYRLWFS